MKTIISHILFLSGMAITSLVIAVLSVTNVNSEHDPLKTLRGPAFDDTSKAFLMPEDWKKQPIKYDPPFADADIMVTVDGQMFDAWTPIIQNFAKKHNLKIITNPGTCGVSAGGLSRKSIDVGAFCCPPHATDRLPGLKFHTLGISAIALFVHADNPVDNITFEQAQQIYRGNIYRWSDINGSENIDLLIQPVGRLHCKLRPGHWRLILDNEDFFSPSLIEVGAIPDMISQVAINPGAIGFEVPWMTRYYKDKGEVKILKINGYDPDESSYVLSNKYPIYRVYSFTTWEGENVENTHAQKLVKYLLQQSEHLDSKYSFISASRLKKAGWKFNGDELVGEPR
jgi:hypothetical protein